MTVHPKPQPQFVIDGQGKRRAVLLSIEEYQYLLEALEDQFDAADLNEAIRTEDDFVPYDQVCDGLRHEGKL